MSRILVVSNRLPVSVSLERGDLAIRRSVGGLATGLAGIHERSGGTWIGWPGIPDEIDARRREALDLELEAMRLAPVHLSADDVAGFYTGFSNGVLWPLLHSMLDKLPLHTHDWSAYVRVNEQFAAEVVARYRAGDRVWIHDYHLMLVPAMVRRMMPEARIGFFLHIPFPSSSVFRSLPQREAILHGLLGADLVGFHTASYVRNFVESLLRILGVAVDVDRLSHEGREVRVGAFPMGIDAGAFAELGADPEVIARANAVREGDACSVLVGIDRLDYTKGIARRLLAFEHLLKRRPELRERVRLVQVAVPSRGSVDAYRRSRNEIDALVGNINGAFATSRWSPVRYLHRGLGRRDVVALYRAADVMVVTPVRDGMNLVAKEFAASRVDEDGVLVLSEFAGASAELAEALHVNPYDVEGTSETLHRALSMPPEERRDRMRSLRRRVLDYDVGRWGADFLETLGADGDRLRLDAGTSSAASVAEAVERARGAARLLLVLDYDGTLVPFASSPDLAQPDRELVDLLGRLAARPDTDVHLVSGRSRDSLQRWFADLPLGLHAEHGLWSRARGAARWTRSPLPELPFRERIDAILEDFAARTPGASVERKASILAWHWRGADPLFGRRQACELRLHLAGLLSNIGAEVVSGDKVIEVRPYGVHKGTVVTALLEGAPQGSLCVAIGDDRTDEDLFAALPDDAVSVHVGPHPSRARIRLAGEKAARAFLGSLLREPSAA